MSDSGQQFNTIVGGYERLEYAAELIKRGEIVAFPTETVYGLGGDALNTSALNKIFEAKNRPKDNPFILHVTDIEQADRVAHVTGEAEKLFKLFSPGPLTIVMRKRECVPYEATAGLDTVGVRIPSHPMCREFLTLCDIPVAAPSANLSKKVSPTCAEHVYEDMAGRIPLILDGGECNVGIESTVLSLATDIPTILRPGIITEERLAEVLGEIVTHKGEVKRAAAPGMKYRHYAPIVPCYLFKDDGNAISAYDSWERENLRTIILCKGESRFGERNCLSLGDDGVEIAKNVFRELRNVEKKYDRILIEHLSLTGEEGSVMNRLIKSCDGNFI